MKKNNQKFIAAMVSVAMFSGMVLSGCGSEETQAPTTENTIGVAVSVQEAHVTSMDSYIKVSSKVSPNSEVMIIPKIAGTVNQVNVKIGDMVKAGQTLFVVDSTDIALQSQQAQAGYNSAKANYEMSVGGNSQSQLNQAIAAVSAAEIQYNDMKKALDRTQELYEIGGAALADVEQLETSVEMARQQYETSTKTHKLLEETILEETKNVAAAGVAQAEASMQTAQNQLKNANVKAEINGVIGMSTVVKGATVAPGSPVMSVVDMNKVKVALNISDDAINKVQVGTKVYITISAASDTVFEGTIASIAPVANAQTLLYPVEVYINNADHMIKPGMFASAKIVLERKESVFSVPLNAVIEKNDEKYVFVVDESGNAKKVVVETGIQNDDSIEIASGLNENDQVIIKGQDFIAEGSKVEIIA